jgi:aminopeptidase YwaD
MTSAVPRRSVRACAAALLLLATGAAARATPEPSPEPPQAPLTPEIDAQQFLTRDAYLSSEELEGRESGTPGGTAAEDYVAAELARCGLEPAGEAGAGFQRVALPWRPVLAGSCSLTILRSGADPVRLTPFEGAVPFSTSAAGFVEAAVVFAGYGLTAPEQGYDDWAGVDARGKVALVLRHGPREDRKDSPWFLRQRERTKLQAISYEEKAKSAARAGAAAVLFVNDGHHKDEALQTMTGGGALPIPAFAIPREAANRILRDAGKELADFEALIDRDLVPRSQALPGVRVALRSTLGEAAARNVLYLRRGSDAKLADEVVLVTAHLDHVGRGWFGSAARAGGEIHNGADDNASGTAALLEVAEHLAAAAPLRRTVLFAGWCGEEKGLVGSEFWCAHPTLDLSRVVANVNLDMVGRYRTEGEDAEGLSVVGAPTGTGLAEKAQAAAKATGTRITPSWDAWEQSDHFSLYQKKVPVLFLHTGLHPDYHRPADDWWKLDAKGAALVAQYTVDLVRRLADDDARPAFVPKPPRAVLGVTMGDAEESSGASLGQVIPGLAAAASGLQTGDVILEAGGAKIRRAGDLTKVLEAHKPGDEIEIVFRRGAKTERTRAKLSGR